MTKVWRRFEFGVVEKYKNMEFIEFLQALGKNLGFYFCLIQILLKSLNFWCRNSQKVLPCRHFKGSHALSLGS